MALMASEYTESAGILAAQRIAELTEEVEALRRTNHALRASNEAMGTQLRQAQAKAAQLNLDLQYLRSKTGRL